MIIQYSENNENRIEWQHRRGEEWKTAELDELIEAYERATEPEDLISREAAINALIEWYGGEPSDIEAFKEIVEALPPAEKTGKWIDHQIDRWVYAKCSRCGSVHDVRSNYCPSCGARMVD